MEGSTWAASSIFAAELVPMPKIRVRATSILLFFGRSIPAILANFNPPFLLQCRYLCDRLEPHPRLNPGAACASGLYRPPLQRRGALRSCTWRTSFLPSFLPSLYSHRPGHPADALYIDLERVLLGPV